jgi:uncharacterized protein (TIRG00374 family)
VSAAFLALLFLRFDFAEMRVALAEANYLYLIPGIAVYFVALYFRSMRWRYVLQPFAETRTMRLFPVVMVGYMANNVLPMRIGEFARSYYLSRREPVRGSTALATIVIERVFDGLTLLFIMAVAAVFLPVVGLAERISESAQLSVSLVVVAVVAPFVVVLMVMVTAALYPQSFIAFAQRLLNLVPAKIRARLLEFAVRFLAGFEGLQHPTRLASVFLLSLPVWLAEAVMYYIVALGFDLQSHFDSLGVMIAVMLIVTSISNLATSVPSSQGSIGPFEFFAREALVFLSAGSISVGLATAYSVVLHAALLLPVIATGLLHLALVGISLGDLTKRRPADTTEDVR